MGRWSCEPLDPDRDLYDKNFGVIVNGEVTVDGIDGIATITGGAPRMRVPDIDF